jgi:hypothetical protein
MHMLLAPPSLDDLIRLLRAWRFWLMAALAGALLGAAAYALFPPPYRARAVVNVDFNLEQAWPQETDRQQFYYLERETRKLEEIAWSDAVMQAVAKADGRASVLELRGGILQLSQPAEAGWHFYARDPSAERARSLASAWARAFVEAARSDPGVQVGLSSFARLGVAQADALPAGRALPLSSYLLAGMLVAWFLGALSFLFVAPARSLD